MSAKVFSESELLQAVGNRARRYKLTMDQAVKALQVCPRCKSSVTSSSLIQTLYGCRCPNCGVYFVDIGGFEMRMGNGLDNRGVSQKEKA